MRVSARAFAAVSPPRLLYCLSEDSVSEASDFLRNMGIGVDAFAPLRKHPTILVYGPAGTGKTTELIIAFQNAPVWKTAETVTRPYYSWLRELKPEDFARAMFDWKKANAANSTHPLFESYATQAGLNAVQELTGYRALMDEIHVPAHISNWGYFESLKNGFLSMHAAGQPPPFPGVIIDEGTEVIRRIYSEMLVHPQFFTNKGKLDLFAVMRAMEKWLIDFCEAFRSMGMLLAFTGQEGPPQLFEERDSLHYGKQKYKGGPVVPFGSLRKTWAHALDICIRITLQSGNALSALPPMTKPADAVTPAAGAATPTANTGTASGAADTGASASPVPTVIASLPAAGAKRWVKRQYWTEAHPDWETKFRDFGISYQEDLGLRRLLERASYL